MNIHERPRTFAILKCIHRFFHLFEKQGQGGVCLVSDYTQAYFMLAQTGMMSAPIGHLLVEWFTYFRWNNFLFLIPTACVDAYLVFTLFANNGLALVPQMQNMQEIHLNPHSENVFYSTGYGFLNF